MHGQPLVNLVRHFTITQLLMRLQEIPICYDIIVFHLPMCPQMLSHVMCSLDLGCNSCKAGFYACICCLHKMVVGLHKTSL